MLTEYLEQFLRTTGFAALTWEQAGMIAIALILLYLAIKKDYEPLLLVPIAFGIILANLPLSGMMEEGGLLRILYQGVKLGIYPSLVFLGIGAMTDFGPLIASPRNLIFGAAAQVGVFVALVGAVLLGFPLKEAASIGIIGAADGPTTILFASRLAPDLLAPITVIAYSYMALVPIIQPPVCRALVPLKERQITMSTVREVTKTERIAFPLVVALVSGLLVPESIPLVGMLMLGNLIRECGVVERLSKTLQNELPNIVTILLGLSVGASAKGETFLTLQTLGILALGLVAFVSGTAGGVLLGRLVCKLTGGKVNPLIGASGISALPMSARVVQKLGQEANPRNYLLMHAMGTNVAGQIGSTVVAGILLSALGG